MVSVARAIIEMCGCLSKDLKEVGEETCGFLREEYFKQRERPMQSPQGGTELGGLREKAERPGWLEKRE